MAAVISARVRRQVEGGLRDLLGRRVPSEWDHPVEHRRGGLLVLAVARISMSSWNGVNDRPGCRGLTRIRRSASSFAAMARQTAGPGNNPEFGPPRIPAAPPPRPSPRVIAVDGKSARGARHADGRAAYLLAAFEVGTGIVLGPVRGRRHVNLYPSGGPTPIGVPLTGHDGRVPAVDFTAHGSLLASAGLDGTVRLSHMADPAAPTPRGSRSPATTTPSGR
jgi:hypothetical protein